jgi:hypothetical protein
VGRSINKAREDQIHTLERSALTLNGFLAALPDTLAKPAYLTDGGRKVLGGGGIVPDVLVMADTLTTLEMEAIRELDRSGGSFQTAVFNYAVRYLQGHPSPPRGFSVGPQDLEDFRALLTESNVNLSASAFRRLERFIRFQIEREIALRAWGDSGEFLRTIDSDRVVQRALALLKDSGSTADLLRLAAQVERSDWIPVVAVETPQESGVAGTGREEVPQG